MPEIDFELENVRLNAYLEKLEDAQDALAQAGINDSARWEAKRDSLYKQLEAACAEIATLHAILRDLGECETVNRLGGNKIIELPAALRERIQDALNRE